VHFGKSRDFTKVRHRIYVYIYTIYEKERIRKKSESQKSDDRREKGERKERRDLGENARKFTKKERIYTKIYERRDYVAFSYGPI